MEQKRNKARVLEYLEQQARPIHWALISSELSIKQTTTRAILSKLVKAQQIRRYMRGFYCNNSIAGLASDLRIHSLQLKWRPANIVRAGMDYATDPLKPELVYLESSWHFLEFEPIEERLGPVIIRVGRDRRRKTISGFLGHKGLGMDLDLFRVAMLSWRLMVQDLTEQMPELDAIEITNAQFNRDLQDVRIEGCKALTVRSVLGIMERFYNKADRVRHEVQATPKSIQDIEHVLQGGVSGYNMIQTNFMLSQEIRGLTKKMDDNLKMMGSIYRIMAQILQK